MAHGGLLSFCPRAARVLIYLIFVGPCRFSRLISRIARSFWSRSLDLVTCFSTLVEGGRLPDLIVPHATSIHTELVQASPESLLNARIPDYHRCKTVSMHFEEVLGHVSVLHVKLDKKGRHVA